MSKSREMRYPHPFSQKREGLSLLSSWVVFEGNAFLFQENKIKLISLKQLLPWDFGGLYSFVWLVFFLGEGQIPAWTFLQNVVYFWATQHILVFYKTSADVSLRCLSQQSSALDQVLLVCFSEVGRVSIRSLAAHFRNTLSGPQRDMHKLSPSITQE